MEGAATEMNNWILLLDTLKNIWQNFLEAGDNKEDKLHWIQLYLFYSKFVDEDIFQSDATLNSGIQLLLGRGKNHFLTIYSLYFNFIHQIPEEICSFFLETVFEIISKYGLFDSPSLDNDIGAVGTSILPGSCLNNSNTAKNLRKNHNFAQVTLNTPSDCNKLVSLRNFLTNQLGQHLLHYLLNTDYKLIASQKSLCNLCINLYPNCPWDSGNVEIQTSLPILEIIETLKHIKVLSPKKTLRSKNTHYYKLSIDDKNIIGTFLDFSAAVMTSDELAYLIIQTLLKCVSNENETKLNEQSMSVITLKFALDLLCGEDSTYSSSKNATAIKFSLLLLISRCLNNIFVDSSNINFIEFQDIFSKLAIALENNSVEKQQLNRTACEEPLETKSSSIQRANLLCTINYIFFNGLHNFIKVYLSRANKSCNNQSDLYYIRFINESMIDITTETFTQVLEFAENTIDIETEAYSHILIENTFKTFINIIDELCRYDQLVPNISLAALGCRQKKHHKRFFHHRQMHCQMQSQTLSCLFQGILFKLLLKLPANLQEYAIHYLIRAGACCCHYTLSTYHIFLNSILNISPQYQKYAYTFLYHNLLCTIFLRDRGIINRHQMVDCVKCDTKLKSVDFLEGILLHYKNFYEKCEINITNLNEDNILALHLLLKHFKHISPALPNAITINILADIVWPTFRQFRANLIDCKKMLSCESYKKNPNIEEKFKNNFNTESGHTTSTKKSTFTSNDKPTQHIDLTNQNDDEAHKLIKHCLKILHECLNIFTAYLGCEIRLIKAFYNEENINHLEDLLVEPELVRNICDLIKIGIDNLTFLGDDSQEQIALSQRLVTLQLKSSNKVAIMVNDLLSRLVKSSKGDYESMWLKDKTHSEHLPELQKLAPNNILYVAALQWSLNHELLKTSQFFYNKFVEMYSVNDEEGAEEEAMYDTNKCKSSDGSSLQHYNKTIADIFKLNYNALNSFLRLSVKKTQTQLNTMQTTQTQKDVFIPTKRVDSNTDNVGDCLSNSLASFISSFELAPAPQLFNSVSSSITSATNATVATTATLQSGDGLYEEVTKFFLNDNRDSFLQNLQEKQQQIADISLTESIVLFDIRNQSHEKQYSTTEKTIISNCSSIVLPLSSETNSRVVRSNSSVFGKLLDILGGFFTGSRSNSIIGLNYIDLELQCLYESNGDCKKYLLTLFEATMAICMKSLRHEEVEKVQRHLSKLKTIILNNATSHWKQFSEDHSRENAIVKILQTLLKIANLLNSVNDPTSTFDSNVMSLVASIENLDSPTRDGACYFNSTQNDQYGAIKKISPTLNQQPRKPFSENYCDAEYYLSRSSVVYDSEIDASEPKNDNINMGTDEGYDADGEIPEFSDSEAELDAADFWNTFQPTSRYRTHVLHSGLCHLVVEILIKLCEKCTKNPIGWSDNLAQLANRLFVIRDYIGDSLYLLRGFVPVLKCNDPRLRDLQQAILELIVDLNTPEILCTFFNILAAKNPPVDILIKYMNYIGNNSVKKPQPSMELDFPIAIDGNCISSGDPYVTEEINRIRNYHLHAQVSTPFTRSPCFIPVTHAKLWNNDGFTISLWLQMKSSQSSKNTSQLLEDDTRCSNDENMKTHITSIGTNQVMLSIYINNNMNLVLESFKPNSEIQAQTATIQTTSNDFQEVNNPSAINVSSLQIQNVSDSHHSRANINFPSQGSTSNLSTFRVALKQTKAVILNSFTNMQLFNRQDGNLSYQNSSVDLSYRLQKSKWVHCTFAVGLNQDFLDITIYINGMEQQKIILPIRNVRNMTRTHAFQTILLGDSIPIKLSNNSNCCAESHTTIDGYPVRFSISNLFIFNRKLIDSETLLSLTAMGPDFKELDHLQVGNWKPNYGFLAINKLRNPNFTKFAESMKLLCNSRLLRFSAESPNIVMVYETSSELGTSCGRPHGIVQYGELIPNQLKSLQTATLLCGGLSTLLYLFARVVEISNNSASQFMALDLLLNVALSDTQLYTEFSRNNYISLIGYVIKTDRCTKDVNLLKSIVNNACSQPLMYRKGEAVHISENTTASVIYPHLIISVLHRYSDWHRSGAEHSEVLDALFLCILALTREKHPQRDFNMEQLNKAGLLKELLNLCKVYIIESPNPVYISKNAAESFIAILSVFTGSPPQPSIMDEIMKLILLLHKPSECYITHDRTKFYFLLTPQPPVKEKLTTATSLGRVTASFRRNFKRDYADSTCENSAKCDRMKRLKKLNLSSSPYKLALYELEENLENVADCIRLNKNVFRSLNPKEVLNWRTKLKQSSILVLRLPPCLRKSQIKEKYKRPYNGSLRLNNLASPQKIFHKRIRPNIMTSTNSFFRIKRAIRPNRSFKGNSHLLFTSLPELNYENKNSAPLNDVLEAIRSQRPRKSFVKADFYNSVGIVTLQEGLITLLRNFLCLLPDNSVEEVLKHYIKVELLLVLSNNNSCAVRTAIIKLLAVLSKRLSPTDMVMCKKNFYPQHLANQMSIHPTNITMFEACLEWVTGVYGGLTIPYYGNILHAREEFGLNTLFAVLTNANDQNNYLENAFQAIKKIFETEEEKQMLIDAGLLQCSIKALYNLYTKTNFVNLRSEKAISDLLTIIGETSLKSVSHINIIWDILTMLSFYQERQPPHVVKSFRSLQCQLQINWLNMFFGQENVTNYKAIAIPDSTLTWAETKMRFDLLIDRCTQFFAIFDAKYTPIVTEIQLFQLLIKYSISTSQRCNNFIAWGLQPSRPRELRSFIVDALWASCKDDFLPPIICDGKIIKSFLWLCLLEDLQQPIENLRHLCQFLGIKENDSTWNLENELERVELDRIAMLVKQKSTSEKVIYKLEPLALSCIDSSMLTTRRVAELQNAERKVVMNQLKEYDETSIYTKWTEIVRRMAHEGAPWYCKERTENSWELDDTEGPSRVHIRLCRCHLDIDKRFLMQDYNLSNNIEANAEFISTCNSESSNEYARPLEYLFSGYDQQLNLSLNSQIIYNFPAKYLPVDGEIDGEIIVTDHKLYFMATYHCRYFYINCDITSITEIWLKRHQHQEKAFEIFLDTNKSLFFSLQNQEDWKVMCDVFCDKIITPPDQAKVLVITEQWREGLLTNWEYLMTLNQFSGRTYNDLMQYPVFPWVLSDYKSNVLDLTNVANFRKLEKPIAVQHKNNEQHYINNYTYISSTMTSMGTIILKPYHYSSHYSNSGTVLHFLVRVPPFTSYFLRYQDNNFDLPDRTFHSLNTTWNLASRDSPTDVKELIPEFFCLPEMFENFEHFNFGCRQNGERVEDVKLPPWSLQDARLFVLIHRQALEAEVTRSNLNYWIDLIFGHKQTGEHAVEAINVFHPATYATFQESVIPDPIERKAVETMIKTYGQMPRQLFKQAHPQSKTLNYCLCNKEILPSVRGLRWGVYVGSPQLPTPTLGNIYKLPGAEELISFNNANVIYGLPMKTCIMQGTEFDIYHSIFWGHEDRIVRVSTLNKMSSNSRNLLYNGIFDEITACGTDPNLNQLWFGHQSGRISIYKCENEINSRTTKGRQNFVRGIRFSYNSAFRKITTKTSANLEEVENDNTPSISSARSLNSGPDTSRYGNVNLLWTGPTVLLRHTDEITNIRLSVEFKIAVSAGRDGIAVIWDLNDWSYIRTINRPAEIHHSPITLVTISPTLGDIVTVHTVVQQQQRNSNLNISNKQTVPYPEADECFEVTEENLDDFVNVFINPNGKSILRLHTINGRYVQHIAHEDRILAVCYSYIKEGVGVNVVATAVEGGIIRLWSSWNLNFVSEIVTGISNIKSITYSTHQHLVVLTKDFHIQVWETDGLYGSSPKFPQLAYK